MFGNPKIGRARELRREMTPAEAILWKNLRGRRFAGFKFRRQYPVGGYFADFCCHACQLIVELDGESHLGRELADEQRQKALEEQGFMLIRFWNNWVYDDLETVLNAIYLACEERMKRTSLTPNPSPARPGEGGGQ